MKIKPIKIISSSIGSSLLILSFLFYTPKVVANLENNHQVKPLLDEIIIISTCGNIPDDTNKIVSYEDRVELFAVVKDQEGNYYLGEDDSLPDTIKVENNIHSIEDGTLKRWDKQNWGGLRIRWYKIMPKMQPSHPRSEYKWYSNVITEGPEEETFVGYAVIEYNQIPLKKDGWNIELEQEAGTTRFRVELDYEGKPLSSPGRADPSFPNYIVPEDYNKGIKPTVHSISRTSNSDNKLIRYIEALREIPWIWGADYKTGNNDPREHQSELPNAIGIECADLIISALRAMGNEKLKYIKANRFAQGVYTVPLMDGRVFQFAVNDIFGSWIPKGIAYHQDRFYVCGKRNIKIFNNSFELTTVIEDPEELLSNYLDIAISSQDGLIYLINDSYNRRIEILDQEGNLIRYFSPKTERFLQIGDKTYAQQLELRPTGIDIDENKDIYLLESDSIYIFNHQGEKKGEIKLESLYDPFVPTGSLVLDNNRIYVPAYDNYILIYDLEGKIVDKKKLASTPMALDIGNEEYYSLLMAPFRIEVRDLTLTILTDSYDRLIDENGNDVVIPIGAKETQLQRGDLIMSREEEEEDFSHTLVFYEDSNKNGILDFSDKLIFAGHEGVMIETVKEKLGRRNFSLRRLDESIVNVH